MTATLVTIAEGQRTPKEREDRARLDMDGARRGLVEAFRRGATWEAVEQFLRSHERGLLTAFDILERRARKAERALRDVLGADLTDEQCAAALSAIHGRAGERRRNPGGLSDHELALVEWYRTLDDDGRQMLRTLRTMTSR